GGTDQESRQVRHAYRLCGKLHVGKHFGNVRVVMAMAVPGPAGAWRDQVSRAIDLFETRTIDAPDVAFTRRERTAVGQPCEPGPRESQFNRPTTIRSFTAIQHSINVDAMYQSRKIPVEEAPSFAAWM